MEDDVIPSNNFLNFFEFFIDNNILSFENKQLFLAAESIFFDSNIKQPNTEHIQLCNTLINTYNLNKYYIQMMLSIQLMDTIDLYLLV